MHLEMLFWRSKKRSQLELSMWGISIEMVLNP